MKRVMLIGALAATALLPAVFALAQMRPGAKVEKTYGLGLPRDMDRLIIPDSEYPVYPLKPGQEAYADVDGYRIKENIKKITAFSLMSLDAGELYWGRIPGTKYHKLGHGLHGQRIWQARSRRPPRSRSTCRRCGIRPA